jgi:hypothetical protein
VRAQQAARCQRNELPVKAWSNCIEAQREANPAKQTEGTKMRTQLKYRLFNEACTKYAFAAGFQSVLQPNVEMFVLATRDTPSAASTHEVHSIRSSTADTEMSGVRKDHANSAKTVQSGFMSDLHVASPAQATAPTSAAVHHDLATGARKAEIWYRWGMRLCKLCCAGNSVREKPDSR